MSPRGGQTRAPAGGHAAADAEVLMTDLEQTKVALNNALGELDDILGGLHKGIADGQDPIDAVVLIGRNVGRAEGWIQRASGTIRNAVRMYSQCDKIRTAQIQAAAAAHRPEPRVRGQF